jgi:hypothetical protein
MREGESLILDDIVNEDKHLDSSYPRVKDNLWMCVVDDIVQIIRRFCTRIEMEFGRVCSHCLSIDLATCR